MPPPELAALSNRNRSSTKARGSARAAAVAASTRQRRYAFQVSSEVFSKSWPVRSMKRGVEMLTAWSSPWPTAPKKRLHGNAGASRSRPARSTRSSARAGSRSSARVACVSARERSNASTAAALISTSGGGRPARASIFLRWPANSLRRAAPVPASER
jgi:hypothetical protein